MIRFGTNGVIPDALGNLNIIDVSTSAKAQAVGLKANSTAHNSAVSFKEVLIEGNVPANKIKVEKLEGKKTPSC